MASNESLSVLAEARQVHAQVPDPPSTEALLRMVTLDSARALELSDCVGSLEAGKWADVAAFPCPSDTTDPIEALITQSAPASAVWIAGRRVV